MSGVRVFVYTCTAFFAGILALLNAQDDLLNEIVFRKVVSGLTRPTSIANASDGSGRLFVTQQAGLVRIVDRGILLEEPFLDLTQTVSCCGEQGLLGIAFHPDFSINGRFFVSYTNTDNNSVDPNFPDNASNAGEVKALMLDRCSPCHTSSAAGGLHIASDDSWHTGLVAGGRVVPGNADDSLLTKRLTGAIEPQMPPGGNSLSDSQINMVREWINDLATNDDCVTCGILVSEFAVSAEDPNRADPGTESLVIHVVPIETHHFGGQLQFDSDGYLYVSIGDGGADGSSSQDRSSLLGKILRLDIDTARPYAVPPDNPFVGFDDVRQEIWVIGLRNPWRFSFDRGTDDLFIGDVGARTIEEINYQPASSTGGENYGWNFREGNFCVGSDGRTVELEVNDTCGPVDQEFTDPILEYGNGDVGCSVIGGYRYRGADLPALGGFYFFGDYCSGIIFAAVHEGDGTWSVIDQRASGILVTTFGEDEAGEIYVTDARGHLFRIAPPNEPPTISSFYPTSAVAGGADFLLVLRGENFVNDVEVRIEDQLRLGRVIDNQRFEVAISSLDIITPGTVNVSVLNPNLNDTSAATIDFQIAEPPSTSPFVHVGGVVGAAGFLANPMVPGSIATIFAANAAMFVESNGGVPLATMLGGATVLVGNNLRAPLFFSAPTQINFQVPWEMPVGESVTFRVQIGPNASQPVTVPTATHAPAIFTLGGIRPAQGAILIANTTGMIPAPVGVAPNTRPVVRGELLEIFATGLGPVTNQPRTGEISISFPLSRTETTPSVTIGGVLARVFYSGLAPQNVGLNQVNVTVPDDAPVGDDIPLIIRIGDIDSAPVIIAVE